MTAETSQSEKTFVFVQPVMTWPAARDYCRAHHTDLAFIENDEENDAVSALIGNHDVWIGLYRVRWTWSDKSLSTYRNWEIPTLKTMIRMKMKTSADITDPATNAQILQQRHLHFCLIHGEERT
ncbi:hypothetical protein EYF80_062869 [Liparis tanakae]|uniref:C-type lectin domain-containing protein n=1 Tax=Liparis tanakae TaxID=230148 RepID=A0A4Z2EE09_9TELE|nr:hypothetical protein EYF80_062869 [Liparis tanakae]